MRHALLFLLMLFSLAACGKKEEFSAASPAAADRRSNAAPGRYMAYEHSVHIEVAEARIVAAHEAVLAACREATQDQCVILESHISTGHEVSAGFKVRAKPAGIRKLLAHLAQQGELLDQTTHAEDLAGPIEDSAKKLEMLNDYRARLEGMRAQASKDIEALIKVNKELAQVQSDIESLSGERAHLVQRVETETLRASITSKYSKSFWRPVSIAASEFGTNLSMGISSAITFIAYLIPWGLCALAFTWCGRRLWLLRKRPAVKT